MVLLVLVLHSGEVKQQMLTLTESLPQARIKLRQLITSIISMRIQHFDEIQRHMGQLDTLEFEVTRLVLDILGRSDNRSISDIYRDGLF